jgi:hypothetical protein
VAQSRYKADRSFSMQRKILNTYPDNPIIIGGQGGTGTRAIAELLIFSKHVELLESSEETRDSISMRRSGLNNKKHMMDIMRECRSLNYSLHELSVGLRKRIREKIHRLLNNIDSELSANKKLDLWGWKEPRTMYYLPFFDEVFQNFRFVHVIRDVRNIRQRHIEGLPELYFAYFGKVWRNSDIGFKKLWSALNLDVYRWAKENIPGRYHLLNIEKFTGDREECKHAINSLFNFIGVQDFDVVPLTKLFYPLKPYKKERVRGIVREALQEFGYIR